MLSTTGLAIIVAFISIAIMVVASLPVDESSGETKERASAANRRRGRPQMDDVDVARSAPAVEVEELWRWDATDLASAISRGEVTSRAATESVLERLNLVNSRINAVTFSAAAEALAAADRADEAVARGEPLGLLHGVPITIKDNVDQQGTANTTGVVAFQNLIAERDSPQVAALRRAGAVIVGRTNTPAFCLRWDTDNDLYGRTYNPWHRDYTAGGSSGGAAAAVATGIGPLALGNDFGGSIRYPAYCCGVAGLRPTPGRVPSFNATAQVERSIALQLMSVQGPLARRVRDLRLGFQAMCQADASDPWSIPLPHTSPAAPARMRVALVEDPNGSGVHPDVAQAVRAAGETLSAKGYLVEAAQLPDVHAAAACWNAIVSTEMRHLNEPVLRKLGGQSLVRAMDCASAEMPQTDLGGYIKALAQRAHHARAWARFLEQYQLIVAPVSTQPPFEIGFDIESQERSKAVLNAQQLLLVVALAGLPAVSVPVGMANGLPMGVQIISGCFREQWCLDAAEAIEPEHGLATPIDPV